MRKTKTRKTISSPRSWGKNGASLFTYLGSYSVGTVSHALLMIIVAFVRCMFVHFLLLAHYLPLVNCIPVAYFLISSLFQIAAAGC